MNIEKPTNTILMERRNKYFFIIRINIVCLASFMVINIILLMIWLGTTSFLELDSDLHLQRIRETSRNIEEVPITSAQHK